MTYRRPIAFVVPAAVQTDPCADTRRRRASTMGVPLVLTALALASLPQLACNVDRSEAVESDSAELVQFPSDVFTGAAQLTYGATSAPILYTGAGASRWGVVRFSGTAGDSMVAKVAPTTADRVARAYLVEKRDGKYIALLSGTNSVDGIVKATLQKTQEFFIVFREYSRRSATFTVNLERAGGLPATCTGAPLLEQAIIDRTEQGRSPSALGLPAVFESSIRRCNVATGCFAPVKETHPTGIVVQRGSDGKWAVLTLAKHAALDGTTGALTGGTWPVRADDGRTVDVPLSGAATTTCISLAGRARVPIDAVTYYDVEASVRATTPPVAARVTQPPMPAPECDGQGIITDEELLARFPTGSAEVALGTAYVVEDQQYCHPETGCQPWTRVTNVAPLTATAKVLSNDQLGITFSSNATTFLVEDGTVNMTADVLGRAGAANTASISNTHLLVKETNVARLNACCIGGHDSLRRFVCIPIPAHP